MSLAEEYQRFLIQPSTDALAAKSSIHYVPTLVSIHEPTAILKHLATQHKKIEKKNEKILNIIEGKDELCFESETTLQCHFSGGTYLPGMDDNLLADRLLIVPIVHIVKFDDDKKIQQIRLLWDQGSLLKQVEVIGRNGRNWPLNDGKDQARLIASSVAAAPPANAVEAAAADEKMARRQSRFGANGDKYTSLSLFRPHESVERDVSMANAIPPRESAKPPPREYTELFAAGGAPAPSKNAVDRPGSPTKSGENLNPLKAGAGKHVYENRLFTEDATRSPERGIKTNAQKYNHFDFGAQGEVVKASPSKPFQAKKHQSQWDFSDFTTPLKNKSKVHPLSARTMSWSDDETEPKEPHVKMVHKPHARPDNTAHFEIADKPTAQPSEHAHKHELAEQAKTLYHDPLADSSLPDTHAKHRLPEQAKSLYHDPLADSNNPETAEAVKPLSNITNQANHRKNFSSQFEITDNASAAPPAPAKSADSEIKDENVPAGRKTAHKTNQVDWDWYTKEPPKSRGIKIHGDGMGAPSDKKGWWEF